MNLVHRVLISIAVILSGAACRPDDGADAPEGASRTNDSIEVLRVAAAPEEADDVPKYSVVPEGRLAAPRHSYPARLVRLWERAGRDSDSLLLAPSDVQFSRLGLLVFDAGENSVRAFGSSSGQPLFSAGRAGRGPGELGGSFWFQGTYARPASFDALQRRLTLLASAPASLTSVPLPKNRRWVSTCALDAERTFGTAGTDRQPDFLTVVGERVVDSLSLPWPHLQALPFLTRQSIVRQLDDSSCAILVAYQSRFAVLTAGGLLTTGSFAESSAVVVPDTVVHAVGKSWTVRLPKGTRRGPSDARAWRGQVVVLFGGRTRDADRVLDVHRRSDLTYVGSIRLPHLASRIAISGDTLAVLGESEDYPLLAVYLIVPRTP